MEVAYDKYGRLKYHPDLHPNQGKTFTEIDKEYICKYWGCEQADDIGLAVGRTGSSLKNYVMNLKKDGRFEYYKNLNRYW